MRILIFVLVVMMLCGVNWAMKVIDTGYGLIAVPTGLFDDDYEDVEKGKILVELIIYDSGEGYIKIGNHIGKIYDFNLLFNIETGSMGGEDYKLYYRTRYWSNGGWYPYQLELYTPQPEWNDISDKVWDTEKEWDYEKGIYIKKEAQ